MNGSIGFSTTQSVGNYPESSFTFQNKFYTIFWTSLNFFRKNLNFMNLKKKLWIGYLGTILDTHFIPLQNEPSPILVGRKLREP